MVAFEVLQNKSKLYFWFNSNRDGKSSKRRSKQKISKQIDKADDSDGDYDEDHFVKLTE